MHTVPRPVSEINTLFLGLSLCLLFVLSTVPSLAGQRVALLIGNGDYGLPGMDLANPGNDAAALDARLDGLGFERQVVRDGTTAQMNEALDWFADAARGAEMAMVFYAGHGVQLNGENYLIAADLEGFSQAYMEEASLTLSRVKAAIDAAKPDVGIIVLDACRNNPFTGSDWTQKGLAVASGGTGLLIAYATDPGNVAFDGLGENSVFTQALLDNIATDGLDVRIMFGRVRQQVVRETGGIQIPWVEESVLGEHHFGAPERKAGAALDDELTFWRGIAGSTDPAVFGTYLEAYPDGLFADFARARMDFLANPAPYQPIAGDRATPVILASADPDRVATSLAILGFMPQTRGLTPVPADLLAAFDAYRATLPDPQLASLDQLDTDAARLTIFLAAATGQRIRTDLAALSSVERTLQVAEDAFVQLVDAAGDAEAYKPLVDEARSDVAKIVDAREAIEERLDGSRTYYETLVLTAQDNYADIVTPDLLSGAGASRSVGAVGAQLRNDARLFLKHVQLASSRARGSYAWMNDFISKT